MMKVFDIQKSLFAMGYNLSYTHPMSNIFIGQYEADFFCLTKAGYSIEFEIKLTKADFKNDFKKNDNPWHKRSGYHGHEKIKTKHERIQAGELSSYFYFVCPKDLIQSEELPERYGLIYSVLHPNGMIWNTVIVKAKKLNKNKFDQDLLNRMTNNFIHRAWKKAEI